jgi:hypothetical protein
LTEAKLDLELSLFLEDIKGPGEKLDDDVGGDGIDRLVVGGSDKGRACFPGGWPGNNCENHTPLL